MTSTAHLEPALVARLREVRANGPATEAELRLLRDQAGGWALALRGQIEASERRLDAAVADPTTSLTEVATELRRLELLHPELAELESLLAALDRRARELRAGWLRNRARLTRTARRALIVAFGRTARAAGTRLRAGTSTAATGRTPACRGSPVPTPRLTEALDHRFGWDKMPKPIAMLTLIGIRNRLRAENLYDSGRGPDDKPPTGFDDDRHLTARTLDGTFNDLKQPLMGSLGSRFGRNVPLTKAYPDPPDKLLEPNPRTVSLRAADPQGVHPGDDPEPARRRLDPVRGARLVQPRQERGGEPVDDPGRRRRPVADAPDGDPAHPQRPELGPERAADLRHRGHALVGRLADLRQRPGLRAGDPLRRERQAQDRRERPDPEGDRGARRPHRRRRQLLGRARDPARAVHARAQRDLRPPAREVPAAERPGPLRQGAARQRGADGEDPHGRLDAGDHRAPDHGHRDARQLVRAARRGLRQAVRPPDPQRAVPRDPRLAQGALRRAVLAHRGVRGRLPDAPAAPRRLRVPRAERRPRDPGADVPRDRRAARARVLRAGAARRPPLLVRRSRTRARSRCTTTRASCRSSSARTARSSTSRRSTSSAPASAASPATTSSGGCSTWSP